MFSLVSRLKYGTLCCSIASLFREEVLCIFAYQRFFFLMWIILKVFIEFVTILLLFYVFLATRHVGSQLPQQGLNPHSLHWKAKS